MKIELSKQARVYAIASVRQYADENFTEPLGELPAGQLLDFFLEEIAPAVYNGAVREAQMRLQQRISDLDGELFADEFTYWPKLEARKRKAK